MPLRGTVRPARGTLLREMVKPGTVTSLPAKAVEVGGAGDDSLPGRVTLKVGGEPGTEFSGTCVVGGKEEDFTGRVPGRFVYELGGQEAGVRSS